MARGVLIGIATCVVVGGALFWVSVDGVRRHLEFCHAVQDELRSLTKKRPPNVSRKQWENVVAWTLNAHGNCITFTRRIPQADRDRFLAELQLRIRGPVNLGTI